MLSIFATTTFLKANLFYFGQYGAMVLIHRGEFLGLKLWDFRKCPALHYQASVDD